jgi:hypothetical protein
MNNRKLSVTAYYIQCANHKKTLDQHTVLPAVMVSQKGEALSWCRVTRVAVMRVSRGDVAARANQNSHIFVSLVLLFGLLFGGMMTNSSVTIGLFFSIDGTWESN